MGGKKNRCLTGREGRVGLATRLEAAALAAETKTDPDVISLVPFQPLDLDLQV